MTVLFECIKESKKMGKDVAGLNKEFEECMKQTREQFELKKQTKN
jgi:hypothetical protein